MHHHREISMSLSFIARSAHRFSHASSSSSSAPQGRHTPAHTTVVKREVGRFRETPAIKAVRVAFGSLSALSPRLAAYVGYHMLAKPPRVKERHWQRTLRLKAHELRLPTARGHMAVYEWTKAADAPVVLMVHGWGARATHMGRMIEPLVEAGFRVVAFDAPAHGESSGVFIDVIEFAAAISAVAKHYGDIHTLIAHSFGAATAMMARRDWGVTVQRQILISSIDHVKWITHMFEQYVGAAPAIVERMRQRMVERHNGSFDWAQLSVMDMLHQARQPTLLIHDQDDAEIPFQHSLNLLRCAPHAQLHVTSGLGHHRLLGNESVITRVRDFVSQQQAQLEAQMLRPLTA
jgi:pimeloyl-ACP methyl ester carboxylesterase